MADLDACVPPHDLAAEEAVVSAVLLGQEHADELVSALEPEDFYDPTHRQIWSAVQALRRADIAVDMVSVRRWLRDNDREAHWGSEDVTQHFIRLSVVAPAIVNASEHANHIRQKARVRKVMKILHRRWVEAFAPMADPAAWLEEVQGEVFAATSEQQTGRKTSTSFAAAAKALLDELTERAKLGETMAGVRTGFRDYDDLLGGWQAGRVYVIGARPGMGKTAFAIQAAVHAVTCDDETGGLMATLEVPTKELVGRSLSAAANIDYRALQRARIDNAGWRRLTDSVAELSTVALELEDASELSPSQLRVRTRDAKAQLAKRGRTLRFVIVDYLQLMTAERKSVVREQDVAEVSRELKKLALAESVAVVALSQLNRASANRKDPEPQLQDLRESGAIEQDADVVTFIHREDVSAPVAKILTRKGRYCGTGECELDFDGSRVQFSNQSKSESSYSNDDDDDDLFMNGL